MNILVVTKSSWIDTNAVGNTLSNFFGDCEDFNFYNIYCRDALPQNDIVLKYFKITERQIVKNILSPDKIGRTMSSLDIIRENNELVNINRESTERKIVDFFREYKVSMVLLIQELLWWGGSWKNKKLTDFIYENKIDIIFSFAADPIYMQNIVDFCLEKSGAKLVQFFADDVYAYKTYSPLRYFYQFLLRRVLLRSVSNASLLYGASKELCDEYSNIFGKTITPLYKGCCFANYRDKTSVSRPIKIVYAGNLLYGRLDILAKLAREIDIINRETVRIVLNIYTSTTITHKISKKLNIGYSSFIMGKRPYEEIKAIIYDSDITLHVESFLAKQIKTTRLSFSTKIIDCMQSGSCILAIGPEKIASIKYLEGVDGAIVITDIDDIYSTLKNIVDYPQILVEKAKKLSIYAKKNHNLQDVRDVLRKEFSSVIKRNT